VGSSYILESAGAPVSEVEERVLGALRGTFKPEFLNRIDDIVVFRPLGREQIDRIVDLQLARLTKLLADKKLTLELTPEARTRLGDAGYDPVFGARPLKRAVQRLVQNPLALLVLEGRFVEGDHILAEVAPDGGLTFRVPSRAESA
jgi:ATP-dependent Clp protease ATP-binding subunit ClpB